MKIAISPDENPGDPGAVHNGIVERDVNVAVATALEAALKRCGQEPWFDSTITFEDRIRLANQGGFQVLVACAHNAAGSPAAEGAQFLFCGAEAHSIGHQQAAADNCGRALVAGGLVAHYSTYDEDVAECCDFNGDTVYCEFGFETNPTDASTIKQPGYAIRAAELLCSGLAQTYGFAYASPTPPEPEWEHNLVQLPAPLSGVLASELELVDTVNNQPVQKLAQGAALTLSYATTVRSQSYYMTAWAVEHKTGYAVLKSALAFEGLGWNPPADGKPLPDPNEGNRPSQPPANPTHAPDQTGARIDFQAISSTLINWFDEELVRLIEMARKELEARGGAQSS